MNYVIEDTVRGCRVNTIFGRVNSIKIALMIRLGVEAKDVACCTGLERAVAKRLVEASPNFPTVLPIPPAASKQVWSLTLSFYGFF